MPKVELPKVWFGCPNCTRLNRLNISPRNWSARLSRIFVSLNMAKSKFAAPCPRSSGSVRDSLPNVNAGGAIKQDVLNHLSMRDCAEPDSDLAQPAITLGRRLPPNELVVLFAVMKDSGVPDVSVVMPLIPQPEMTVLTGPGKPFRSLRPLPTGTS